MPLSDFLRAPLPLAAFAIAIGLAALSMLGTWRDWYWLRWMPRLHTGAAGEMPAQLSIIIPARNEELNIERCVRGAVQQLHVDCEVIVVDDGSADATPAILAGLQAEFPDVLRVVPGRPLPPGWIGKCNACQHGGEQANGEWLLFLDADTEPRPDLAAAMLRLAERERLDALSVLPRNALVGWAERAVLPIFWWFAFTVFPVMRGLQPELPVNQTLAIGQCFLFRADAYRQVGGHAAVRDRVLEDVAFAGVLRANGLRVATAIGADHIDVRMYRSADEVAQGLMKHANAGRKTSGWRGMYGILAGFITHVWPALGLLIGIAGLGLGWFGSVQAGLLLLASGLAFGYNQAYWRTALPLLFKVHLGAAWLMPAGMLIYMTLAAVGTLRVGLGKGVAWKGRIYDGAG